MLQEHYELSLEIGREKFLTGVKALMMQKAEESARRQDSAVYIHLLFCMIEKDVAKEVRETIRQYLPQAVVTGMSETLFGSDRKEISVKINFTFFASSQVQLICYEGFPADYGEEGRLFFSADVYQGEKLRLSYAVKDDLLQCTERASEDMCGFAPQAMFLVLCGNRTLFLREDAHKEVDLSRIRALASSRKILTNCFILLSA